MKTASGAHRPRPDRRLLRPHRWAVRAAGEGGSWDAWCRRVTRLAGCLVATGFGEVPRIRENCPELVEPERSMARQMPYAACHRGSYSQRAMTAWKRRAGSRSPLAVGIGPFDPANHSQLRLVGGLWSVAGRARLIAMRGLVRGAFGVGVLGWIVERHRQRLVAGQDGQVAAPHP